MATSTNTQIDFYFELPSFAESFASSIFPGEVAVEDMDFEPHLFETARSAEYATLTNVEIPVEESMDISLQNEQAHDEGLAFHSTGEERMWSPREFQPPGEDPGYSNSNIVEDEETLRSLLRTTYAKLRETRAVHKQTILKRMIRRADNLIKQKQEEENNRNVSCMDISPQNEQTHDEGLAFHSTGEGPMWSPREFQTPEEDPGYSEFSNQNWEPQSENISVFGGEELSFLDNDLEQFARLNEYF